MNKPQLRRALVARSAGPLHRHRRREVRHHRSGRAGALSGRDARPVSRPHAGGAAAGLGRRSRGDPQARQRDHDRRSCRRAAIPAWSAGRSRINGEIVLSLNRLDKIREVDPVSNTMTCEAGVTLQRAREAAADVDRLYPQLLPSEGTCTIGGNLSTNAGGTAALAHGIARSHALGLEVVLADGRVLNNLNKLKKDNTGYDLQEPVHRRRRHARRHHRRGAAAGAAAALGRDRLRRRALAAGRGRAARPRAPSAPPAA